MRWYVVAHLTRQEATPDEARQAVAELLPQHPDVLKIAVDQLPIEPRIGSEVIAAIAAAGHEQHVRSVAHVGRSADVLDSVHAGVDAMMHSPYQEEISDEAVAALAAKGIPVVATLAVWDAIERVGTVKQADFTPLEREIAKPAVLDALVTAPASWSEGSSVELVRMLNATHAARRQNVQKLRAAGITILAGSDAANLGSFPGAGLHLELGKLVEAGMTPGEALRAATSDNARFLEGETPEAGEVVGPKDEDVLVKVIGRVAVLHREAHMNDPLGNARGRQKLAEIAAVQRSGDVLHKLHIVAVRISNHEAVVAVIAVLRGGRHIDAGRNTMIGMSRAFSVSNAMWESRSSAGSFSSG